MGDNGCVATVWRMNSRCQTIDSWWKSKSLYLGDKIKIRIIEVERDSEPLVVEPLQISCHQWTKLDKFYALERELEKEGIDIAEL